MFNALSKLFSSRIQDAISNTPFHTPKKSSNVPYSTTSEPLSPAHANTMVQNHKAMYTNQASSPFISKLPVEVRDMIWMHLFSNSHGERLVHFTFEYNHRLRGCLCSIQELGRCPSRSHSGPGFGKQAHRADDALGWMGAIVSCRALYFETTKILYSTSTFDISDCWKETHSLPWLIPLRHLAQISKINLVLLDIFLAPNTPNYPALRRVFRTLESFQGLIDIRVEIASRETHNDPFLMSNASLALIEDEIFGCFAGLEGRASRKKNWILQVPGPAKDEESQAEKDLVAKGWKVLRT